MKRISTRCFAILAALFALMPMLAFAQDNIPGTENPVPQTSSSIIDGFLAMSNESLYLMLVAIVTSIACGFIFKQTWNDDYKAGLYGVICLILGAGYTYVDQDHWSTTDWIRRFLTMAVVGTVFYKLYKPAMRALTVRTDEKMGRTKPVG